MAAEAQGTDEDYWVHGADGEVYRLITTEDLHGDYPGTLEAAHVSWQGSKGWNPDAATPRVLVTAVAIPVIRATTRPNEFCPAGVEFLNRWEVSQRLRDLGVVASIGVLTEDELALGLSERVYRRSSRYRESRRQLARAVLEWLDLPLAERPAVLRINRERLAGVFRFAPTHSFARPLFNLLVESSARELLMADYEKDPEVITLNAKDGELGYLAATKATGKARDGRRHRRQETFSNLEKLFPIEQLVVVNGKLAAALRERSEEHGCTDSELLELLNAAAQPAKIAGAENLNDLTKIVSGDRPPYRAAQLIAYAVQRYLALPYAVRYARLRDNEFWAITDVKMKLALRPPKDAERFYANIASRLNIKRKEGQYEDNRH